VVVLVRVLVAVPGGKINSVVGGKKKNVHSGMVQEAVRPVEPRVLQQQTHHKLPREREQAGQLRVQRVHAQVGKRGGQDKVKEELRDLGWQRTQEERTYGVDDKVVDERLLPRLPDHLGRGLLDAAAVREVGPQLGEPVELVAQQQEQAVGVAAHGVRDKQADREKELGVLLGDPGRERPRPRLLHEICHHADKRKIFFP